MFISITFRATSIDETNKTQQTVRGSNIMFKMSTIHANTMLSHMHPNDYTTAQSLLLRWRCGPAASIPSADVLSTPSHQFHGSASGRPSLDRYPRCCRPPDSKIWRIGWPHLWRAKLWRLYLQHGDSVTCTVNDMISVTSTFFQWRQHYVTR